MQLQIYTEPAVVMDSISNNGMESNKMGLAAPFLCLPHFCYFGMFHYFTLAAFTYLRLQRD